MRPDIKKRIIMAVIVTVALYGVLILGSQAALSPSEAKQLSEQLEELAKGVDSPYFIFINNFGLSLLMAIPFAGPLIAGWIVYETGRYFAAIAIVTDTSAALLVLLPLFLFYGLLEFIGYGGMVTGSIIMSYKIFKRQARVEIKYYLLTLLLSAVIILAAAFIEYYIIETVQNFLGRIQNIV